MTRSFTSDLIGFVMGFFFGCCGLLLAGLWMPDYFRGAVTGLVARFGLGLVLSIVAETSNSLTRIDPDTWVQTFPWELLLAFGIGTVFVLGTIAGAIWAFGGRDEDDEPPPPPVEHEYVTYTRQ